MNLSLSGGYLSFVLLESWGPLAITYDRRGRESTTEQSLGGNAAELVGWAYRGTHETSNQWTGFT